MAESFALLSTQNMLKGKIMSQFLFGRDIIILIKHIEYWKLISKVNQAEINYYNNRKK